MKTQLPDPRVFPRYSGVCSFFRYPIELQPKSVDWVVYGVPFDLGTTYRSGARFGPRAIREQSAYIKPYHMVYQQHLLERYSLADGGDAPVSPFSLEKNVELHEGFANAWRNKGARTFAVGGDHSTALGNMRATSRSLKSKPALVHFDSHTDTVDVLWGEKYTHASPIMRSVEEGLFDPEHLLSIGVKGPVNTSTELDWGIKNGIQYLTYDQWREEGDGKIRDFVSRLDGRPVYLTFDIDVMDPSCAPGTGTPSVGGYTSAEIVQILRLFRGINLQGADLVEVSPPLDHANLTSLLAAHLIFEILSL